MITLNYGQIKMPFVNALNQMYKTMRLDAKNAYRLAKIRERILSETKIIAKLQMAVIDAHAKKDENGKILLVKDEKDNVVEGAFDIKDEEKTQFETKMNEIFSKDFQIHQNKIQSNPGMRLTAEETELLSCLIEGLDD